MTSSLLPTYARVPLAFARGEGVWLETVDGARYLDLGGGIAVASLGYSHPHLVEALTAQAGQLWHTSNLFVIPQAERLGDRLVAASFADYVFFTNSGAEALEGAIKTARKYHAVNGQPERFHLITFEGAFHGRTLATIAAGGQRQIPRGLRPEGAGFRPGALRRYRGREGRDRPAYRRHHSSNRSRARGGIRVPPHGFFARAAGDLRRARAAARRRRGAVRRRPHRQAVCL